MWGTSTLCSSRSSRMVGAWSASAWVLTFGLVINLGILAISRPVLPTDAPTVGWLVLVGVSNVVTILLVLSALRVGKVSLVAPIVSADGALGAVFAVLAGETLGVTSALLLLVITGGVVLAAVAPENLPVQGERKSLAVTLAIWAVLAAGFNLYATGHVSSSVAVEWVALPPRLIGFAVLAVPLALAGKLRLSRKALPLLLVSGAAEVVAYIAYAISARHGIAIASVLASQFAVVSAVGAYIIFGERLTRLQLSGVVVVICGVSLLAAIRP
jgi:drug/metabolite transporter (DMT)-like permease